MLPIGLAHVIVFLGGSLAAGCVYFATTTNTSRINSLVQINGLWQ